MRWMGRCAFFPCSEILSKEAAKLLHEEAARAGAKGRCAFFPCAETLATEVAGKLHEGAAGAAAGGVHFAFVLRLWQRKQRCSYTRKQHGLDGAVCIFPCAEIVSEQAAEPLHEEAAGAGATGLHVFFLCTENLAK